MPKKELIPPYALLCLDVCASTRHALTIGSCDFVDPGVLQNSINDAQVMYAGNSTQLSLSRESLHCVPLLSC
jgi:hypothetical protein